MTNLPPQINRAAERIQELKTLLAQPAAQQAQVEALVELGWELRMSQPEQAKTLGQKAEELSKTGDFSSSPYGRGLAGGLVVQAFVEVYAGKLDRAVSKCLQALDLLQEEPDSEAIKACYTLGWANFFLSDYPSAMNQALKALQAARETGARLQQAWVLDLIASLHGTSSDFALALETHQEAAEIFDSLDEVEGKIRALNNLATTLHKMEKNSAALERAREGLEIARQWSLKNEMFYLYCTLAQILIDIGELGQAEACLLESLTEWTAFGEISLSQVYVLMEWGRLYLLKDEHQAAEAHFLKALALAERLGQPTEQALCHRRLSEFYEKQGNYEKAFTEFKTYHTLTDSVTGERANQRLAAFQITYQLASARHAAEIYHLQTIQLQHEVDQQKLIQEDLEQLTRVDSLTGIANRRYFDEKITLEYTRLARSGAELSLIMLDADHFKAFNDLYGHVSGDDCLRQLAQVLKRVLVRPADLAARYGGEEFACLLPDTGAQGARKVAEKIQQGIRELAIPHQGSSTSRQVTVSMGVATTHCVPGGVVTELILGADRQLYQAKTGGRNQIQAVILSDSGLVEQAEGDLVRLVWKKDFSSGHPLIDAQHQELFALSNQLFDAILSTGLQEEIYPSVSRLFAYLEQHFRAEENILQEFGYPALQEHAAEHALLLKQGSEVVAEFQAGDLPIGKIFHYLTYEVIARHILIADRKYFPLIGA